MEVIEIPRDAASTVRAFVRVAAADVEQAIMTPRLAREVRKALRNAIAAIDEGLAAVEAPKKRF